MRTTGARQLWSISITTLAIACGGTTGPGKVSLFIAPVGTWTLRTIDGATLPVTRGTGNSAITITAATLTVSGGGSYRQVSNVVLASGQASTTSELGTWTQQQQNELLFEDKSDGTEYAGSFSGDTLFTRTAAGRLVYTAAGR